MISKKPLVISLVGAKRCGKDTVAQFLEQNSGYVNWKIAANLKNVCKLMFGFSDEELETDLKEVIHPKWGVSPRFVMQTIGTDIVQYQLKTFIPNINKTFWVEKMFDDYNKSLTEQKFNKFMVISDMRFMHEFEYLKEKFGENMIVIKLVREHISTKKDNHVSEHQWDMIPADITITNNSTIHDLYTQIKSHMMR
jgi:hypothetical protein